MWWTLCGWAGEPIVIQEDISSTEEQMRRKQQMQEQFPGHTIVVQGERKVVAIPPTPTPAPIREKVAAIFVSNRARNRAGLNEEVDNIRELISSELGGEVTVLDSQYIGDAFRKRKIDSLEEQNRMLEGVFTGGSALQVARMLEADYLVTVAINSADVMKFSSHVNYRTTLSVKVLDGQKGGTLDGFRVTKAQPVRGVEAEGEAFFRILFEDAATEIGERLVKNLHKWHPAKAGSAQPAELATFEVTSTVDQLFDGLEEGVRAPEELLNEVRRVVGGATVWVNGAVVGSSPGRFSISPGMHTVRVTRQWMDPWEAVVHVRDGMELNVALEMSNEGIRKWQSVEGFKANLALQYARALMTKGIKVNLDTENWQQVGSFFDEPIDILIQQNN